MDTTLAARWAAPPLHARMANPASVVTDAMDALLQLDQAVGRAGLPAQTRELVHIRVSQLNGCGVRSVQHPKTARKLGETDERIWAIAGWRDAPTTTGLNGPRSASPSPSPGSTDTRNPSRTTCGTKPPDTTTSSS